MANTNEPTPALRLTFLTVLVGVLLVALFSRLWFLQVLAGERYAELSERNRVQPVYTEAPRGHILAADGTALVKNRSSQVIAAHKRVLLDGAGEPRNDTAEQVLGRLSTLLDLPVDEIVTRLVDRKYSPFSAAPIKFDVAPEVVYAVREHQELFPGVVAETRPVRDYPFESLAAHTLGYTGEISDEQLDQDEFSGYRAGDIVGKSGLETSYEQALQGERGRRLLEVNAQGTVLQVLDEREPVPGHDLKTSIDIELQQATERLLAEGMEESRSLSRSDGRPIPSSAGAAVVLDVDSGQVVAMASNPTWDPRELVGSLRPKYAEYMFNTENEDRPTPAINRAIQGLYPPGSTFKAVTASAFLASDLIEPYSTVPCPPTWHLGSQPFNNWNRVHEGDMNITRALERSCDTFFYELADRQRQREVATSDEETPPVLMAEMARQFGFDEPLGIDIPNEKGGIVPDRDYRVAQWEANKDWWCEQQETAETAFLRQLLSENCESGFRWRGGDPVIMAIGQGEMLVTPLQVASSLATIANDGKVMWPHLGVEVLGPDGQQIETIEPRVLNEIDLADDELEAVQRGLEDVVMGDRGTASTAFQGFDFDQVTVAGKTGTAEIGDEIPYAWFAAYAPVDDPQYAIAVMVEEGSGGSVTAAPIVRNILEAAFDLNVSDFEAGAETD